MDMMKKGLAWLKARVSERTSWDGAVIIAGCLVIILTGGLAKVLAWIGLAYGLWTCYKEEVVMPYHHGKKVRKRKRTVAKRKRKE